MPIVNIVVSTIGEERTLKGSTKSTENVISYVGGIDGDIVQPGQEMYLNVGTFNDQSQIPPRVAAKIKAQAAKRMTTSSLARKAREADQRQGQVAYR